MHNHDYGVCPVCNGTGRAPASSSPFLRNGYDKETDTVRCINCGGQTMSLRPTGRVRLRKDGTPCTHKYKGHIAGRCYTTYVCEHCGDTYSIDSGD